MRAMSVLFGSHGHATFTGPHPLPRSESAHDAAKRLLSQRSSLYVKLNT